MLPAIQKSYSCLLTISVQKQLLSNFTNDSLPPLYTAPTQLPYNSTIPADDLKTDMLP